MPNQQQFRDEDVVLQLSENRVVVRDNRTVHGLAMYWKPDGQCAITLPHLGDIAELLRQLSAKDALLADAMKEARRLNNELMRLHKTIQVREEQLADKDAKMTLAVAIERKRCRKEEVGVLKTAVLNLLRIAVWTGNDGKVYSMPAKVDADILLDAVRKIQALNP